MKLLLITNVLINFRLMFFQGGAGTSVNMNANEVIANLALELMGHKKGEYHFIHPNDHVNKCQSTNDAYPTAFRIALYHHLNHFIILLNDLVSAISIKSNEFSDILKMGRTQLQDAVPMSLGQEFHAFATLLKEDIKVLNQVKELILEVNLRCDGHWYRDQCSRRICFNCCQKIIRNNGIKIYELRRFN